MAWLEKDTRTGILKVAIRLSSGKLKRSLRTTNRREAESVCGTVENTLTAIERGWHGGQEMVRATCSVRFTARNVLMQRPKTSRCQKNYDRQASEIPCLS
jgi:hypothetical protein